MYELHVLNHFIFDTFGGYVSLAVRFRSRYIVRLLQAPLTRLMSLFVRLFIYLLIIFTIITNGKSGRRIEMSAMSWFGTTVACPMWSAGRFYFSCSITRDCCTLSSFLIIFVNLTLTNRPKIHFQNTWIPIAHYCVLTLLRVGIVCIVLSVDISFCRF